MTLRPEIILQDYLSPTTTTANLVVFYTFCRLVYCVWLLIGSKCKLPRSHRFPILIGLGNSFKLQSPASYMYKLPSLWELAVSVEWILQQVRRVDGFAGGRKVFRLFNLWTAWVCVRPFLYRPGESWRKYTVNQIWPVEWCRGCSVVGKQVVQHWFPFSYIVKRVLWSWLQLAGYKDAEKLDTVNKSF